MKYAFILLFTTACISAFDNSTGLPAAQMVTPQEIQRLNMKFEDFIAISDGYAAQNFIIPLNDVITEARAFNQFYSTVFDKKKNRSILSPMEQYKLNKKKQYVDRTIKRFQEQNT